ncbi:hypothetical protein D3C81_1820690 [compost metagenome]
MRRQPGSTEARAKADLAGGRYKPGAIADSLPSSCLREGNALMRSQAKPVNCRHLPSGRGDRKIAQHTGWVGDLAG